MVRGSRPIQPGSDVYGSDDEKIGTVSEVGTNYIVVEKGWLFTTDLYIPTSAITQTQQDRVYLNVPKDQVAGMGWDQPPGAEAPTAVGGSRTTAPETTTRAAATTMDTTMSDVDAGGEVRIPVVEEELRIDKQVTEQGGVRVTTRVEEQPVSEQVSLRDEEVRVERRPVDRPVADADLAAIDDVAFEVRARDEEAVVQKQARIVEEVVVRKEAAERTEQIQETLRRTEVEVEQLPGQRRVSDVTETTRVRANEVADTDRLSGARTEGIGATSTDEGVIERGAARTETAAERATGLDLDRDRDVGQRDRRDNS